MKSFTPKLIRAGLKTAKVIHPKLESHLATEIFLRPFRFKRPGWESQILQSATQSLNWNGTRLWSWGNQGPKVLLVHGWNGRGSQLGKFVAPLLNVGFEVWTLDAPAHGDSPGNKLNVLTYSHLIDELFVSHGPWFGIIAHSFGAAATTLSLSRGLDTNAVVSISGPSDINGVIKNFTNYVGFNQESHQNFVNRLVRIVGATPEELALVELAKKIKKPALIIHDPEDKEVPYDNSVKLAQAWGGSQLIPAVGLGHSRILKSPDIIEKSVNFFTEVKSSSASRRH